MVCRCRMYSMLRPAAVHYVPHARAAVQHSLAGVHVRQGAVAVDLHASEVGPGGCWHRTRFGSPRPRLMGSRRPSWGTTPAAGRPERYTPGDRPRCQVRRRKGRGGSSRGHARGTFSCAPCTSFHLNLLSVPYPLLSRSTCYRGPARRALMIWAPRAVVVAGACRVRAGGQQHEKGIHVTPNLTRHQGQVLPGFATHLLDCEVQPLHAHRVEQHPS